MNRGGMRGASIDDSQAPEASASTLGRFRSFFRSKSSGYSANREQKVCSSGESDASAKSSSCWGFVRSRSAQITCPSSCDRNLLGTSEKTKLQQDNMTRSRARVDQISATAYLFHPNETNVLGSVLGAGSTSNVHESNTSQNTAPSAGVLVRKNSLKGLWEFRRCSEPGMAIASMSTSPLSPASKYMRRFSESASKSMKAGSFMLTRTNLRNVAPPTWEDLLDNLGAAVEGDLNDPLIFGRDLETALTQEDYTYIKKAVHILYFHQPYFAVSLLFLAQSH